jgi:hypothetical protein
MLSVADLLDMLCHLLLKRSSLNLKQVQNAMFSQKAMMNIM